MVNESNFYMSLSPPSDEMTAFANPPVSSIPNHSQISLIRTQTFKTHNEAVQNMLKRQRKTAVENKRKIQLHTENVDVNYLADCDQNLPSSENVYCCTDLTTISASSKAI